MICCKASVTLTDYRGQRLHFVSESEFTVAKKKQQNRYKVLIKGGESNFNIYTGPGEGHSMALVARNGPFQEYVLCPPVSLFFVLYFPPPYLDQLRLLVCQPVSKGFHLYLGTVLVCIELSVMYTRLQPHQSVKQMFGFWTTEAF